MKDWLAKYSIPLCALFLTGLNVYLNLQNWKKQGTNLMPTAISAVFTFLLWAVLAIAITQFVSRNRKLAERLRECGLKGDVLTLIKKAGTLESLAGRAEWLSQYLEEVWHEFLKDKKNMPNPIGKNSMPDVIDQWTDKQLWRFRIHYQGYLGSMAVVDPECGSELMNEGFPHEGEDYLSVLRKIKAHTEIMRHRANELISSATASAAK
jgi:hypothetical protein